MNTVLYKQGVRYTEKEFKKEEEIENLIIQNSKTLFGSKSIYIDAKKKINNLALGGVIPDGFLFELSDSQNPQFYIVEVELFKHSFFNHIFPQITKLFAFFKNQDSKNKLIENLYNIFDSDEELKKEIETATGNKEIFKFLKDTIENSDNILLIIDNEKIEFSEIINTYTDTWGKMVRIAIVKEYQKNKSTEDSIITISPDFENIETIDIVSNGQENITKSSNYSLDFHLDGIPLEIKSLFEELKAKLSEKIPTLELNAQRYYISFRKKRNFAFVKIQKKKISIVAMLDEKKIREKIKKNNVETLGQSVQNFYNGPCAKIEIANNKFIQEVIDLLVDIQK